MGNAGLPSHSLVNSLNASLSRGGRTLELEILSSLTQKLILPDTFENLRASYQNARPFPHLIIDNLFEADLLDGILAEMPTTSDKYFFHHDDEHQNKLGLKSPVSLGKKGFEFVSFLHSAAFLYLVSEITGIWGLLPDPYLQGGGYHVVPRGGRFDVHADRQTDYATGLRRRLVCITYLNHNWKAEYGGNLELWDQTGTRCEVVVEPIFNRTILFEVGEKNYHGHPYPMVCPENNCRKSFLVYFHTVGEGSSIDMRSSVWAPAFYTNPKLKFRRLLRDLVPPIISRYVRERRIAKATRTTDFPGPY
jgi:hypothetical protein